MQTDPFVNYLPKVKVAFDNKLNLAIVENRWPHIYQQLITSAAPRFALSNTVRPTLMVDGKQLTSGYHRQPEAVIQSSRVQFEAKEVYCYGFALGDLPSVLLARPHLEKLHVVIFSRAVSYLSLQSVYQEPWLKDKRVELHLASEYQDARGPMTLCPIELYFSDDDALPLSRKVSLVNNQDFVQKYLQHRAAWQMENYKQNEPLIKNDPNVRELFTRHRGAKMILYMGGPTGKDYLEWTRKQVKQGTMLVCATTALRPLVAQGLYPNYTVCEDPFPDIKTHFESYDMKLLEKTSLAYIPTIHPDALRAWPHRRYRSKTGALDGDGDCLWMGGSVVHTALDLCVQMGASAVYLVGADLCYPNNRTHIDGASHARDMDNGNWHKRTLDGYGKSVFTDDNLIQYAIFLETYIAQVNDFCVKNNRKPPLFFKLGKGGVPIKGMTWHDAADLANPS